MFVNFQSKFVQTLALFQEKEANHAAEEHKSTLKRDSFGFLKAN